MNDIVPCNCGQRAAALRALVQSTAEAAALSVRNGQLAATCLVCGRGVYVQFDGEAARALPPFVGLERGT